MSGEVISILVVDDNPGDVRLVEEYLKDTGGAFHTTHAATLMEALVRLRQQAFNVVLLDLNLPETQGLESLDRLLDQGSDTPVVVLTGLNAPELGLEAVSRGAQDYLAKDRLDGELLGRTLRYAVERHGIEAQLREREERYRFLVENIPGVVYYVSLEEDPSQGRLKFISSRVQDVFGYQPEQLLESPDLWLQSVHPDDVEAVKEATHAALEAGQGRRTYRFRHGQSGEYRWVDDTLRASVDPRGKRLGYQGVAQDVTESNLAQEMEALRKRELEALNRMFQEHLGQRFQVVEAYQQLLEGLRRVARDADALLERASSLTLPER